MDKCLERLRGHLIVSCQALPEEPLHSSFIMGRMALAAMQGGASGIRANTKEDIAEIRRNVDLPIIGIVKREYEDSQVYITPTMKEIDELMEVKPEIIALDATGALRPGGLTLKDFVGQIREKYPNITSEVIAIKNNFFGEKITVSGLITGQDLIEQLSGRKLGDRLLIPCNMLRSGEDVFLDDITITELSEKLGKEIIVVDPGGADLVSAVLDPVEHKKQIRRQMYEQTSSCNSGKA